MKMDRAGQGEVGSCDCFRGKSAGNGGMDRRKEVEMKDRVRRSSVHQGHVDFKAGREGGASLVGREQVEMKGEAGL